MKVLYITNLRNNTYLGKIAVADTFWQRIKGLLGTKELAPFQGLLIQPCKQVHTFGMHYPISVWYVDHELQIIHLVDNLRPCRISPVSRNSSFVIEFPPNWAYLTDTHVGDHLIVS